MNKTESKRPDTRSGAVLVEAIVITPILALVLAGTLALYSMYDAKLEAKSRARRLAWLQADSGECPASSCSSSDCAEAAARIQVDGIDGIQAPQGGRFSLGSFVGDVGRFFVGSFTHGLAHADAHLPGLLGKARATLPGRTRLLCNTRSRRTESGVSVLERACATDLRTTEYAREICR